MQTVGSVYIHGDSSASKPASGQRFSVAAAAATRCPGCDKLFVAGARCQQCSAAGGGSSDGKQARPVFVDPFSEDTVFHGEDGELADSPPVVSTAVLPAAAPAVPFPNFHPEEDDSEPVSLECAVLEPIEPMFHFNDDDEDGDGDDGKGDGKQSQQQHKAKSGVPRNRTKERREKRKQQNRLRAAMSVGPSGLSGGLLGGSPSAADPSLVSLHKRGPSEPRTVTLHLDEHAQHLRLTPAAGGAGAGAGSASAATSIFLDDTQLEVALAASSFKDLHGSCISFSVDEDA